MIDPNILLQSTPVRVETPLDAATQVQNLKNLGTQNQIQQGTVQQQAATLAATEQENQQRQIDMANQAATNAAIAKNVKTDPDGKPYIDHSGVVQTLTQGGNGVAALSYSKNATAIQEGVTRLAKANQDLQLAHTQNVAALAGSVVDAPEDARPTVYAMAVHSALTNHQIQPGEMPDSYDPSLLPRLQQLREAGQSAAQQISTKHQQTQEDIAQQNAESNAQRADAAEERADAYQQWLAQKGSGDDDWKPGWVRGGHQILVNKKGETRDAGPVDMDSAGGGGGGRNAEGLTPGQAAVQARADAREQRADRTEMDSLHMQRTKIGGALSVQNGSNYIDPKTGKLSTEAMNDDTRSEFEQQYRDVTNAARRLQSKWNWNEISPAPGASQPAAAAAPAAPAPAAPKPAAAPAPDPNQKISVATPDGKYLTGTRAQVSKYLATKGLTLK